MVVGQRAQTLEETGDRRRATLQRLDDDAGDVGDVLDDDRPRRREVVERRDEDLVADRRRDAGAGRLGLGEVAQPLRKQAGDADVVGAVIGALELEDLGLGRHRARQALAVHIRLGARGAKSQTVTRRAEPQDRLGERQRVLVDVGEVGAERGLARHRLGHRRVGVADQHRAPANREVEELAAVGVPQPAAVAARDDHRELGRQVELAVRTGREGRLGARAHRCHGRLQVVPARGSTRGG